jgi:hypothetical protein
LNEIVILPFKIINVLQINNKSLQSDMSQIKTTIARKLKERWEAKRLHGQFPRNLDEGLIYKEQSYRWLKFGDIEVETENIIMAAQGQAISTNYFKKKMLIEEIETDCVKNMKRLLTT